jgi:xylulokinase
LLGYQGGSSLAESPLAAAAAALPPGAEGLVFLPYLEGERAPLWDPLLRGAFAGLSLAHRPEHMLRAVMESIAFALRDVAETMEASRLPVAAIRLSGAPSRNASWNRIKADVLERELFAPQIAQTEVSGSAALALAADGRFASVKEASAALSGHGARVEPDHVRSPLYEEPYRRFLSARGALSNPGFRSIPPKGSA